MDIMMPKLDGYSACKEIRKLKEIPVIMLSARGEEYDKLFGFEIGVDDYVVKLIFSQRAYGQSPCSYEQNQVSSENRRCYHLQRALHKLYCQRGHDRRRTGLNDS